MVLDEKSGDRHSIHSPITLNIRCKFQGNPSNMQHRFLAENKSQTLQFCCVLLDLAVRLAQNIVSKKHSNGNLQWWNMLLHSTATYTGISQPSEDVFLKTKAN